jgi:hypothetical protein
MLPHCLPWHFLKGLECGGWKAGQWHEVDEAERDLFCLTWEMTEICRGLRVDLRGLG